MTCSDEAAFLVTKHLERAEVSPVVCYLLYVAVEVCAVHILATMPYSDEIDIARIGSPAVVIHV